MPRKAFAPALIGAGIIPFAAGTLAASAGWVQLPGLGVLSGWFDTYGLVIGAFMAGTWWGRADPSGAGERPVLLAVSNIAALALWAAAATTGGRARDLLLALFFAALLAAERAVGTSLNFAPPYRTARILVTASVVICLLGHAAVRS